MTQKSLNSNWQILGIFFRQKRERSCHSFVCLTWMSWIWKPVFPSTHTKLCNLLSCCAPYPWSVKELWVAFLIFLRGLTRVINCEVREIIIGHVELTFIFFVWGILIRNRDIRVSKGPFLGLKTKTFGRRR